MQSLSEGSIGVNRPVSQTVKPTNVIDVLRSEHLEAEHKPESQAITEETTSGLQAIFSPLSQATDEHNYTQDDPLASIIEDIMVVLVGRNSCTMLC